MIRNAVWFVVVAMFLHSTAPTASSQEPSTEAKAQQGEPSDDATADREQRLADYLSGIKFVGSFTVDGKEDKPPKAEEYTISKCEKLPTPDMYRITARIKYGDVDNELPMNITILWSGGTPVITLDSSPLPGMGIFSARVLIHSGRYAGTWQHDEVGGHLFGKLIKQ